jgi:hypothetical protein
VKRSLRKQLRRWSLLPISKLVPRLSPHRPLWGESLGTRLPILKLGSLVCCEYFQSQVSKFKIQGERRKRSFFVRYWTVQKTTTQFSNNLSLNYWSIYAVQSTECTLIISGVLKRIPQNCEKNHSGRLQYNFFFSKDNHSC